MSEELKVLQYSVSRSPTVGQRLFFIVCGVITSTLNLYVFQFIRGYDTLSQLPFIAIFIAIAAIIMHIAYHNLFFTNYIRLAQQNRSDKVNEKVLHSNLASVAFWDSIYFNNLMFYPLSLFLAFGLYSTMPALYNFGASIITPALVLLYLTSPSTKKKEK